jgi:hypothetical protein
MTLVAVNLKLTKEECKALWLMVDGQLDAGAGYLSDEEQSSGHKLIAACTKVLKRNAMLDQIERTDND